MKTKKIIFKRKLNNRIAKKFIALLGKRKMAFFSFIYLLRRYKNKSLIEQLDIIRPLITIVRLIRSGRPQERISHIKLDSSYAKAIRWLFVVNTPKKELAPTFFKIITNTSGLKERLLLQKNGISLRIGNTRIKRKRKKYLIFFKKVGNKLKRIRKKKGFWKHVKTRKLYKVAKKHKKKRGKFLLKLRFQFKKRYKKLHKIGYKVKFLAKEIPVYPQKRIVRILKENTYFYDLQKNSIKSYNKQKIQEQILKKDNTVVAIVNKQHQKKNNILVTDLNNQSKKIIELLKNV